MATKKQIVQCRCCHRPIDRNVDPDGQTWCMPSRGWYYHKECYNNWKAKGDDLHASAENDDWKDLLWDYLSRDVKVPKLNFQKFDSQWNNFLLTGKYKMTAKGLFFAARYFYEVIHGKKEEAQGGIGILPYIYGDSCTYWSNKDVNNRVICNKLQEQFEQSEKRETIIAVRPQVVKKDKPQFSLADVLAMEDEEEE